MRGTLGSVLIYGFVIFHGWLLGLLQFIISLLAKDEINKDKVYVLVLNGPDGMIFPYV